MVLLTVSLRSTTTIITPSIFGLKDVYTLELTTIATFGGSRWQ